MRRWRERRSQVRNNPASIIVCRRRLELGVNFCSLGWVYGLLFFFFQAEDGIRDVAVTGVQTCALPISSSGPCTPGAATQLVKTGGDAQSWYFDNPLPSALNVTARDANNCAVPGVVVNWRSEERRVGKECRSRWSPYH